MLHPYMQNLSAEAQITILDDILCSVNQSDWESSHPTAFITNVSNATNVVVVNQIFANDAQYM